MLSTLTLTDKDGVDVVLHETDEGALTTAWARFSTFFENPLVRRVKRRILALDVARGDLRQVRVAPEDPHRSRGADRRAGAPLFGSVCRVDLLDLRPVDFSSEREAHGGDVSLVAVHQRSVDNLFILTIMLEPSDGNLPQSPRKGEERMAKKTQPDQEQPQDMTDEEIRGVFETLRLSTAPKPVPLAAQSPPSAPVIYFTVSGHSPPLNAR